MLLEARRFDYRQYFIDKLKEYAKDGKHFIRYTDKNKWTPNFSDRLYGLRGRIFTYKLTPETVNKHLRPHNTPFIHILRAKPETKIEYDSDETSYHEERFETPVTWEVAKKRGHTREEYAYMLEDDPIPKIITDKILFLPEPDKDETDNAVFSNSSAAQLVQTFENPFAHEASKIVNNEKASSLKLSRI